VSFSIVMAPVPAQAAARENDAGRRDADEIFRPVRFEESTRDV